MDPRQACLDCLAQEPPALFEAALWIAAEHLPAYSPAHALRELDELVRQIGASLDDRASASERAQGLLRRMSEQGFCEDDDFPLQPRSALLPLVLQRRQGQPLSLALVAMELARRLDIPLVGVNFPGRFLLRVPLVGRLVRSTDTARFASTLAILTRSGVPLVEALAIAAEVIANRIIRNEVVKAAQKVREGASLTRSLEATGQFPPMMLHMIASGERSGELDQMLARTARNQENDLAAQIGLMVGLFEPFMLIFMGAVVLVIVLAILLPILSLNQLVG